MPRMRLATLGVELLKVFHLLADSDEFDRLVHHCADGKGRAATGVAVELRQNHPVEVQSVVEFLGSVDRVLTRHRVHHEKRLLGIDSFLDALYLVHHLLVYGKAA